ncbi:hypothetical protein BHYA_0198g00260 [Botrytis hyacinthi]|uniref:Uncharacterized protein n=1 Tax=Botrytis hyacinthi TaxID=278943 RepID=A0A4Z1GE81_9HELO|nr:hypothetical protein BHYA_0198g00260 [Botrytis hyacinthi]
MTGDLYFSPTLINMLEVSLNVIALLKPTKELAPSDFGGVFTLAVIVFMKLNGQIKVLPSDDD